jgi:hypothetical protein
MASPPAFDPSIIGKVVSLAKDYHMEVKVPDMK